MHDALITSIEQALSTRVESLQRVSGGDVAESFRVRLGDGATVFVKTHERPPPRHFSTEASGLEWLRAAGAVLVPEVLAVSDAQAEDAVPMLVLEWVEPGSVVRGDDAAFGEQLAALHRCGAPSFGREDRRHTGSRSLPNEPHDRWSEFYASCRLLPLARIARDEQALRPVALRQLEDVAGRLEQLGGPPEPPARLHGDLWAGNRLVDATGRSWLIDPAAHGGHREFDLAMMALFGGFGPGAVAAYDAAFPLAEGWPDRIALHQLAPLVVHAIKFGGGYPRAVDDALARYC